MSKPQLRVIAFPGAPNLPTFTAIEHNQFSQRGFDVDLELTPSSIYQAEQTSAGNFDIICTAFDNVVAYGSGQGAAKAGTNPNYVVVMGATQLELSLVVGPEIKTVADLDGNLLINNDPYIGVKVVDGQFVIDTTADSEENIRSTVASCPSGALKIEE